MKKTALIFYLILSSNAFLFAQESEKILAEGKLLCRLEKASWYGTDDFLVRFADKQDDIGGYLSYENENHEVINIFYKRDNSFHILARYTFDSLPQPKPKHIDTLNHAASSLEKDLITIRQDAMEQIYRNTDKFFLFYENTSFNVIPLINKEDRQVFVLTASHEDNLLIIGNDYLLSYDKKNKFLKKEKIHQSMLQYQWKSDKEDNKLTSTYHSHVMSDYINSTDICTLLLYKEFVEWKQHYVIGQKYVSIFDLEKESLLILTREAWDKIGKEQDKKK
jgi:hypothetical protein